VAERNARSVWVSSGPVRLDYIGLSMTLVHWRLVIDRSPGAVSSKLGGGAMSRDLLEEQNVWFWLVHLVVLPAQALQEN
jgi:hypothetical protein